MMPAIKIRALTKFPSRVLASGGVSIAKANGIWTFGLDFAALQALATLAAEDLDNLHAIVYNSDTEGNARLPLDVLIDAMVAAVEDGLDPTLVAIAGLSPAADQMIYWTGADVAALATLTAAGRALLDDADAAAQLTTLGISAFVQTILDDANAAAVLTTIGAAASGANTDITSLYLNNTGLKIKDTNASHGLTLKPGSDLTADRTLTLTTGDNPRTITLQGDPTLNDWFDQSVKLAASPTFVNTNLTGYVDVVEISAPSSPSADHIRLYAKDVAGSTHLFQKDSGGTETDLTSAGAGTGDVVGPASATDNTIARYDSTTGKLIQGSVVAVADTTGALTRTGGGGIIVQGTNTNDDAATGNVGEFVESSIASGSAVSLSTGTTADVTSISLTAGDWDVWGNVALLANSSTVTTIVQAAINTVSATLPTLPSQGAHAFWRGSVTGVTSPWVGPTGSRRVSLSATTTVYLIANATFTTSTNAAYGYIGARRRR